MSDNPITMKDGGYGNAPIEVMPPHTERRYVGRELSVPGAIDAAELPYIATKWGGICIDASSIKQDPMLLSAVQSFLGPGWENYELPIYSEESCFWKENCALVCKPVITTRTLLRKRRQTGDSYVSLYNWEGRREKPTMALMVTKDYPTITLKDSGWFLCGTAGLDVNYNYEGTYDNFCVLRNLCYFVPRTSERAYRFNDSTGNWESCTINETDVLYGLGEWRLRYVTQTGDGISDMFYATLGQKLLPVRLTGDLSSEKIGAEGLGLPIWGTGNYYEDYAAPAMLLENTSFGEMKTLLERTGNPYDYGTTYYEKLIAPAIANRTMPGIYRGKDDGKIYKIVGGVIELTDTVETSYPSRSDEEFKDSYNVTETYGRLLRTVKYWESIHFNHGEGGSSISATITIAGQAPLPPGLAEYVVPFSFFVPGDGKVSAAIGAFGSDNRGEYGVTDIDIVNDGSGTTVKVYVDLFYCYNNGITSVPVRIFTPSNYSGSEYAIDGIEIAGDVPSELEWEPFPTRNAYPVETILPGYHF